MVEDGEYHHPEPYMNLGLTINVAQSILTQLQVDSCPEDRLELVRRFINETIELKQSLEGPPWTSFEMMPKDLKWVLQCRIWAPECLHLICPQQYRPDSNATSIKKKKIKCQNLQNYKNRNNNSK